MYVVEQSEGLKEEFGKLRVPSDKTRLHLIETNLLSLSTVDLEAAAFEEDCRRLREAVESNRTSVEHGRVF